MVVGAVDPLPNWKLCCWIVFGAPSTSSTMNLPRSDSRHRACCTAMGVQMYVLNCACERLSHERTRTTWPYSSSCRSYLPSLSSSPSSYTTADARPCAPRSTTTSCQQARHRSAAPSMDVFFPAHIPLQVCRMPVASAIFTMYASTDATSAQNSATRSGAAHPRRCAMRISRLANDRVKVRLRGGTAGSASAIGSDRVEARC